MSTQVVPPSEWWAMFVKDEEAKRAAGLSRRLPERFDFDALEFYQDVSHEGDVKDDVVRALQEVSR